MRNFLLALSFIPILVLAQSKSMITGSLIDSENGTPLEFATVSVINPSDQVLVTGGVTDSKGGFAISLKPGVYTINVQFVTYAPLQIKDVKVETGKATQLGRLSMEPDTEELGEVVVQAERTQMEMNLDKKVYNVGKDLSNLGGSASDILSNLPSVTVDIEGNVELRGSSNVKVLIDGKPSGLVGLSSSDALRQLQGNLIERIEIVTNPSARYDAEGQAGIINIVLKKDSKKGINGSFQVNTGYPQNHGASVNMNFRREWVNLFVNYGLSYRDSPGGGKTDQEYHLDEPSPTTGETDYFTKLRRDHNRAGISNSIRFGSDFYLSDKTTLTAAFLYRYSDEKNDAVLDYRDFDFSGNFLEYTLRNDKETEGDHNLEYSLNLTKQFTRKEQKLTADIQYQSNNEIEKSNIVQSEGATVASSVPALFQKVKNDEGEKRLMLQADYIHPFGLKGKFETGFRSTNRHVKNIYNVDERTDESEPFVQLDEFSTDFAYLENVHAAYGIVSDQYDKFSWQVGLRAEMTDISSEQKEDTVKRDWNYINYFPSAFLTYKITEVSQIQLSYSRRINRPRFRELNPFSSFTDNRNFRVGNPTLQPEFTDSYEAGLLQNFKKSSFYYGVYYRLTGDLIQRVTLEPNEEGQRILKPFNIGERHQVGVETNISNEFIDWYRINANFNFFRSETNGSVGDTLSLNASAMSFSTRISNIFKLGEKTDAQLNLNYRAPENRPQGKRYAMSSLDLGISRDVFGEDGTISLSVTDLFNTRKYRFETQTENFYEKGYWQRRRGPSAQLTFIYRLNQKKQRPGRGENGGEFMDDGGF
ncbi:MAG: outer membrane beta-barrel family protein [Cyclobacteriaceae bacterium]